GVDYEEYELSQIAFDYDTMMEDVGYTLEDIRRIQREVSVGDTPLVELRNLTALARKLSEKGKGARIFIKDEAGNPSGSFKDRRASLSVYKAKALGYKGVVTATSGNYGAAVASQAAKLGLKCIVVQECYDSQGIGQPEILETRRKCEALGAEVISLTVGPELFYSFLGILEETGYFNASLYSSFGIRGVETLGYEIAEEVKEKQGKFPEVVMVTHAGGGNITGTARGLRLAGAKDTKVIGVSVDLKGLHMASDVDFNKKSFTTGHTGFGIPFATNPDRSDVPRSAARPLRYMDEYYLVKQGEVFYMTEALAQLEGLERGPAGNTSLTAAFAMARQMNEDEIIVVQETEYTGAGKHPLSQLSFARERGIEVFFGNPEEEVPGKNIILPESPTDIRLRPVDMENLKRSFLKNIVQQKSITRVTELDLIYLMEETRASYEFVKLEMQLLGVTIVL
ncbi:MAG TPA: 2-amino-4-oxopentanoate thiolase subunit OrtB, partial [Bacteroidales bacterium]|nr:2-amino-4-oxopentanoate thiolase subunit OrtB [Bacteroidales bacterium]